MERDTTHEQETEGQTVYGRIVSKIVEMKAYVWECPACGGEMLMQHPDAIAQAEKGIPFDIPGGKCPNPECEGTAASYKTTRPLTAIHTKAPNRHQRRTALKQVKNTGRLRGPVNGS